MRTRNIRAQFHWWLSLIACAGLAAFLGGLAGALGGLVCGAMLGVLRDNIGLTVLLAGRGAVAGLGTGAILGILVKMLDDGEEEDWEWMDGSEADYPPPESPNGKIRASGPHESKQGIRSR